MKYQRNCSSFDPFSMEMMTHSGTMNEIQVIFMINVFQNSWSNPKLQGLLKMTHTNTKQKIKSFVYSETKISRSFTLSVFSQTLTCHRAAEKGRWLSLFLSATSTCSHIFKHLFVICFGLVFVCLLVCLFVCLFVFVLFLFLYLRCLTCILYCSACNNQTVIRWDFPLRELVFWTFKL